MFSAGGPGASGQRRPIGDALGAESVADVADDDVQAAVGRFVAVCCVGESSGVALDGLAWHFNEGR
jgi:hypothetical protein